MSASSLAGVLKKNDGQTGTAQASGQQARRAGQAGASSKVTVSKAFGGADAAAMGKQVRAACGTLTVRTVAASAPYGCSLCSVRLQEAEVASDEVRQVVAAVRSDADVCCWCLLGYSEDKAR